MPSLTLNTLPATQMMRIRRTPTANQAGLFDDMPDMVAVTNPAWFRKHQDRLVNLWRLLGQALSIEHGSNVVSFCVTFWWEHCELGGELPPPSGRQLPTIGFLPP